MASLTITPSTLTLAIGEAAQISASTGGVKWSCSRPDIALVTASGSVTGLRNGTVEILARKGNATARATAKVGTGVEDPPLPPPPVEPPPPDTDPQEPTPTDPTPTDPPPVVVPPTPTDPAPLPPIGTTFGGARLVYRGVYRYPFSTANLYYGGGFALRIVNGKRRILTSTIGEGNPATRELLEYELPEAAPALDIAAAPRMVGIATHGDLWASAFAWSGTREGVGGYGAITDGGKLWDEERKALWLSYGDPYGVGTGQYPTLLYAQFKADGSLDRVYGPWRQQLPPNMTRDHLTAIPAAFGDAYLGGARIGITSGSHSGIVSCARGSNLVGIVPFDPLTLPPAVPPSPPMDPLNAQVRNRVVLMHDAAHRQARDTRWKVCGWASDPNQQHYSCDRESYVKPGPATFGGPVGLFDVEDDTTTGSVWIQAGGEWWLVVFGILVTTPEGYRAPGDPDGLVHTWYGDPEHASKSGSMAAGFADGKCCHGQSDPFWGATGPGSHLRIPHAWVYRAADLVPAATGQAPAWTPAPTATIQFTENGRLAFPGIDLQQRGGWFGGGIADPSGRYVYVAMATVDPTSAWGANAKQPVVGVFELVVEP
jgi:hypothetical protein